MEAQSQLKTESLQETLTPEYAARFLFHSFRHSQGDSVLQSRIFSYAHLLRPDWTIDDGSRSKIREISQKMVFAFLGGNGEGKKDVVVHTPSAIGDDAELGVMKELDYMEERFDERAPNRDELSTQITKLIIERDLKYLTRDGGRERAPASAQKPLLDPWLSFLVHFGLNRNPTGMVELDEMYKDVRVSVTKPSEERDLTGFNDVLRIYQEKHPGTPIDLNP